MTKTKRDGVSRASSRKSYQATDKTPQPAFDPLFYTDLSEKLSNEAAACNTAKDVEVFVMTSLPSGLDLSQKSVDLKQACIHDIYFTLLWFPAREWSFTPSQLSATFSIFERALKPIQDKKSLEDVWKVIKSCFTDCENTCEFTEEDALQVMKFLHQTLLQHFYLYQMLFTQNQTETVLQHDLYVNQLPEATVPWPPPLLEAVPDAVFSLFGVEHVIDEQDGSSVAASKLTSAASSKTKIEMAGTGRSGGVSGDSVLRGASASDASLKLYDADTNVDALIASLNAVQLEEIITSVCRPIIQDFKNELRVELVNEENKILKKINQLLDKRFVTGGGGGAGATS